MLTLKKILGSFILFFILLSAKAQDTTKAVASAAPVMEIAPIAKADSVKVVAPVVAVKADSMKVVTPAVVVKSDSLKLATDSLKLSKVDTLKLAGDTLKVIKADSINKLAVDTLRPVKTDSLKMTAKTDTLKTNAVVPVMVATAPASVEPKKVSLKTGWAFSLKAGTYGLGGEIVKELGKKFSARLGGNYFGLDKGFESEDIGKLNLKLQLLTFTLIGDWYFVRFMHLSAGIVYNLNRIELTGTPNKTFDIGTYKVKPEEVGTLNIKIASNRFTPYLGLGFGRPISRNGRISFNTDLGVLYTGGPRVEEFSATGLIAPTGSEKNAQTLERNLKGYNLFPVVTFQLSYKFIK